MGRAVRRPQVAKSCHIDQLGIWPTCSRRAAASESKINAGRRPQAAVRENHATLTRLVYGRLVAVGTSQSASLTALLSREPYSNISTGWWQWRIYRGLCEL